MHRTAGLRPSRQHHFRSFDFGSVAAAAWIVGWDVVRLESTSCVRLLLELLLKLLLVFLLLLLLLPSFSSLLLLTPADTLLGTCD